MLKDAAWTSDMRDAAEALEMAQDDCDLNPQDTHHRRGDYLNL